MGGYATCLYAWKGLVTRQFTDILRKHNEKIRQPRLHTFADLMCTASPNHVRCCRRHDNSNRPCIRLRGRRCLCHPQGRNTSQYGLLASLAYMAIYALVVAFSLPGGAVLSITGGFLVGAVWGTVHIVISATHCSPSLW